MELGNLIFALWRGKFLSSAATRKIEELEEGANFNPLATVAHRVIEIGTWGLNGSAGKVELEGPGSCVEKAICGLALRLIEG